MTGLIRSYDRRRGFGIIQPLIGKPDAATVFFHASSVLGLEPGEEPALPRGCEVSFDLVRSDSGPQAIRVKIKPLSARALWPKTEAEHD